MEPIIQKNIFFQYLVWYFIDQPKFILRAWRNFLVFGLNYFSIPLLVKTLFSYWHRYRWEYPKGLEIAEICEAALSNFISRFIGAIMRTAIIIIGVAAEIFIFFVGLIIFIVWLALPAILLILLMLALKLLF